MALNVTGWVVFAVYLLAMSSVCSATAGGSAIAYVLLMTAPLQVALFGMIFFHRSWADALFGALVSLTLLLVLFLLGATGLGYIGCVIVGLIILLSIRFRKVVNANYYAFISLFTGGMLLTVINMPHY